MNLITKGYNVVTIDDINSNRQPIHTNIKEINKQLKVLSILKEYFKDYKNKTKLLNTYEFKDEYELLEEWLENE